MKRTTSLKRGHVGLFLLLITIAVIVFLIMLEWGVFAKKDETGKTRIEQDFKAVDDAQAAKRMIEQGSKADLSE